METTKYSNSKIYRLICEDGHYYIGSTVQTKLNLVLNNHKYSSRNSTLRVYEHINNIGWDNVKIELIEDYPCNSKQALIEREKYHINNTNNNMLCLNNAIESNENTHMNNIVDNKCNKYQNGKIYRLICEDGRYYYGSTIQKLYIRLNHHKCSSKTDTNKIYLHINKIGWDNVKIELIESYPCDSKQELNKKEEYYINQSILDPKCLNTISAYLTEEQQKERIDTYQSQYRIDNAEKRRDYSKQYALEHPDQVKDTKKKYREENKENIAEYWREYRSKEENKEKLRKIKQKSAQKIKEQNAEIISKECEERKQKREEKSQARIEHDNTIVQCICGGSYQNYRKKRHDESKKHLIFTSNSTQVE